MFADSLSTPRYESVGVNMSESNPITGVVSSLKTVRDQYQQQLQNIPQYATFLRVQQLTEISPAALGIAAGTEGFSTAHDAVAALAFARDKFKEHLASVPEYRALVAIDKLIADLEVTQQVEAPAPVENAAEAVAEPAQETAAPAGILADQANFESAVNDALSDVSSLSDLPLAAESAAAIETAASSAETPVYGTYGVETHPVETAAIETTVGEVAFEPYPDANLAAEQTAGETPSQSPGAERAA